MDRSTGKGTAAFGGSENSFLFAPMAQCLPRMLNKFVKENIQSKYSKHDAYYSVLRYIVIY